MLDTPTRPDVSVTRPQLAVVRHKRWWSLTGKEALIIFGTAAVIAIPGGYVAGKLIHTPLQAASPSRAPLIVAPTTTSPPVVGATSPQAVGTVRHRAPVPTTKKIVIPPPVTTVTTTVALPPSTVAPSVSIPPSAPPSS